MSNGFDMSKLVSPRRTQLGWTCQCPCCAEEGKDLKSRNHLLIRDNGAFGCAVNQSREHYKRIYQLLRDPNAEVIQFIENEPTRGPHVEKIYPEESLNKLMPDYSYWESRKIRADVLRKLENGVAPKEEKSKLSNRSIFPIRDPESRLIVGFTGRLTEPNSFAPKWKHIFSSKRSIHPWMVNGPAISSFKRVVLVEGISDLLALMSNDINECLCIFGLNLNGRIISTLIANDIKNVVISLNRDEDESKGQAAAEKARKKLVNFWPEDRIITRFPPVGFKDWGEVNEAGKVEEFEKLREELGNL